MQRQPRLRVSFTFDSKCVGRLCFVALWFLLVETAVATSTCSKPIKVLRTYTHKSSVPVYSCYDSLALQLFSESSCDVQFIDLGYTTATRRQKMLEEGSIDITLGLTKTNERETYLNFSTPMGANKIWFFTLKTQPQFLKLDSFCGAMMKQTRVLIPRTGYYGPELELMRNTPGCAKSLDTYNEGPSQALLMLQHDRADIFLATDSWWNRNKESVQNFLEPIPTLSGIASVHIAYRKDTVPTLFIQQVDERIKQYSRKNGPPCGLDAL